MPKLNTINLYLSASKALAIADALEATMPDLAKALRERVPLEGPAPWRKVVSSHYSGNPGLGGHAYLRETLECGHAHELRSSNRTTPIEASRRRCQECQNDLRRAAGWTEWQIDEANGE